MIKKEKFKSVSCCVLSVVVLIYGSHRISEPLAYEVGQKVLQRAPTIKGIENPNFQSSDWILLFNQFCEVIRNGSSEYQPHNFMDFLRFAGKMQCADEEWCREAGRTHHGQAVYDLHNRVNSGAVDKFGIRRLIPEDSPTLKYRPVDGTRAVVQITAAKTDAYPNDTTAIEELARTYHLRVIYKRLNPGDEAGLIEINLPDYLPNSVGVDPENKENLEQCVENIVSERRKSRAIEYGDKLQEALELERLSLIGGFSLPDRTNPLYVKISHAVTDFLVEFLKLHT